MRIAKQARSDGGYFKRGQRLIIVSLYRANEWSAADKPDELQRALLNSHSLVFAWHEETLVGLGNAISDGFLVVYYPHLLVLPEHQRKGIGGRIMDLLTAKYAGFHQQILVSDGTTIEFYKKCGFEKAGQTQSMWIYKGGEH